MKKTILPFIAVTLLLLNNIVNAQPVNNDCSGALLISVASSCFPVFGTTVGATQSLPAIECAGYTGDAGDDVWYKFVAPGAFVSITVSGVNFFDVVVDLRSGGCEGTTIDCSNSSQTLPEVLDASGLTPGQLYYIRIYSGYGPDFTDEEGDFTICVVNVPPPNDDCSDAIPLDVSSTCNPVQGSTSNATSSLPQITCGPYTGNANDDVWYWFYSINGDETITVTSSANFDAIVDLRVGGCNGTNVDCADNFGNGATETLHTTNLIQAEKYYVRVYGYGGPGTEGSFSICVSVPSVVNDNCSDAIELTPSTSCNEISGTTINATQSIIAECNTESLVAKDVWYKFVAAASTQTIKVTPDNFFDAVVDLRTGTCQGTHITCIDEGGFGETETIYASGLTIGQTYLVRVYEYEIVGLSGIGGNFNICVVAPPVNDNCSGAILLTPSQSCNPVSGNLSNSTVSTSTSCAADNMDVWYKFVPTTTNPLITVTFSAPTLSFIDLRSGACSGTSIACSVNNGSAVNTLASSGLTPGATYYILLGTSYTITAFTICVSIPPPVNDECSGAITLTPVATCNPVNGTTIAATQSIGAITCGGNTGNADDDVWYKFTSINTSATITVTGGVDFDAVIDLRTDCPGTNIACADITNSNQTETLNVSGLTINTTYYIRVYNYLAFFPKAFTICVVQGCTPHAYNVTGGGGICPGVISSFPVGLNGSDAGITYQLKRDNSPVGAAVAGTGSPLDLGIFTTAGNYTVAGTNTVCGAVADMSGNVEITVLVPESYYYDADHDGYHSNTQTACVSPGENWSTSTSGPDCNDISPFVHSPISWFYDFDGDFYHGNTVESCFTPPGGYWFDITFGADCDDNNASIQVEAAWYLDADGDSYYINSQVSCNSPGNGYVSSGVIAAGDCDDGNTAVSPDETEVCGNSIDDNCNGQVDENCCDVPDGLNTSGISSNSAQLNWNTVAAANKYKIQYKKDAPGESWLPANVSAPANSYILAGLSSSTKYKWKVKSVCTNGKSVFSSVKKFTTTASKAGDALNNETSFNIYPNPATHSFVVEMNLNDGWNGEADIQLMNELGQLVYTIRVTVNDGELHSVINPVMNLANGNYLVRVIAQDKFYTKRLIIQQ